MITWILIITIFPASLHSNVSYSSIRFNYKNACQKEADKINQQQVYGNLDEMAECVKDGPK
jgi:hypothetical protein